MSLKLIAHRGNTNGPDERENHPDYLLNTLNKGYDCEADVWVIDGKILLGHDAPTYPVKVGFISMPGFWLHAKNLDALHFILTKNLICFWHESDRYTLTSNGLIWANLGMPVTSRTIIVTLNLNDTIEGQPYGICSDYVDHRSKTW